MESDAERRPDEILCRWPDSSMCTRATACFGLPQSILAREHIRLKSGKIGGKAQDEITNYCSDHRCDVPCPG